MPDRLIKPVQDFAHKQGHAMFSGQEGKTAPGIGLDRLWGIPGGFPDLVVVVV
jgi:hypothetical protein